jgi:MFS family permease
MTAAELTQDSVAELQTESAEEPRKGRSVRSVLIRVGVQCAIAAVFVIVAVMLRGQHLANGYPLNPDEAELIGQARAAMRSPIPFTTWTTATTGPIWPLFLATLGVLGLPMTMFAAHFVAAVLVGVIGYLGFTLVRRATNAFVSSVVTVFWWLPFVLSLSGDPVNLAAMSTELLPSALILCAALVSPQSLQTRPWLFAVTGVLSGLAVGAKYQVAPLAVAVLAMQLALMPQFQPQFQWRRAWRHVGWWVGGALAPALILGVAMLVSPDVLTVAVQQNLTFISEYSGRVGLNGRISNWRSLVTSMPQVLMVLLVCWFGSRSVPRVQAWRAIVVGAGLVAVYLGGLGFGHYLIFMYPAFAIALALPLKPGAQLVPFFNRPILREALVIFVAMAAWVASFGGPTQLPDLTSRSQLAIVFRPDGHPPQDPKLVQACPAGSEVLVWGWAPELYAIYSWGNAVPYMNLTLLIEVPANKASGHRVIREAIERRSTACVVDAVGSPFFHVIPQQSITKVYPDLSTVLTTQYRSVGAIHNCEKCTVYVRS